MASCCSPCSCVCVCVCVYARTCVLESNNPPLFPLFVWMCVCVHARAPHVHAILPERPAHCGRSHHPHFRSQLIRQRNRPSATDHQTWRRPQGKPACSPVPTPQRQQAQLCARRFPPRRPGPVQTRLTRARVWPSGGARPWRPRSRRLRGLDPSLASLRSLKTNLQPS